MKTPLILAFIFIAMTGAKAQEVNKMNLALHQLIANNNTTNASVLVKGDLEQLKAFLAANNGVLQTSAGDIASIKIPRDKICVPSGLPS